jgi:hypothetical protein
MQNEENTQEFELDEKQNEEGQEQEETQEQDQQNDESNDTTDWKAEALKYKAILDRNKNKPDKEPSKKSDGLDYAQKAYLKSSGINSTEFDFVNEEMKKSGLKDLDSLLENPYFKAQLENRRELQKTQDATIKGKAPNGVATNSVEYWMSKPIEEVPADMRIKVVNAKLAKDNNKGMFYNS